MTMPNSESLANKVIDRMGNQMDKLVAEAASNGAKLAALDVHMQNFSALQAAANNRFDRLEDRFSTVEDKQSRIWDHYFGSDGNSGTSLEHKQIKSIVDDWISKSKVWRWLIGGLGGSGFVISLFNYFYKIPVPPVVH